MATITHGKYRKWHISGTTWPTPMMLDSVVGFSNMPDNLECVWNTQNELKSTTFSLRHPIPTESTSRSTLLRNQLKTAGHWTRKPIKCLLTNTQNRKFGMVSGMQQMEPLSWRRIHWSCYSHFLLHMTHSSSKPRSSWKWNYSHMHLKDLGITFPKPFDPFWYLN